MTQMPFPPVLEAADELTGVLLTIRPAHATSVREDVRRNPFIPPPPRRPPARIHSHVFRPMSIVSIDAQ
jgi:hypothetical protein